MKYYVLFEYGTHHQFVETNFKDFTEVMNEIKKEFRVYEEKEEYEDLNMTTLSYSLIDYCGNKFFFAFILIDNVIRDI